MSYRHSTAKERHTLMYLLNWNLRKLDEKNGHELDLPLVTLAINMQLRVS
jgi:hypothetical protein